MNKILIIAFLFFSTLTYSQVESYPMTHNPFPQSGITDEWCGTNTLESKSAELLVVYSLNSHFTLIDGSVVYRKYYNKNNPKQIYWDIDHFTDEWDGLFPFNVEVFGYKLK